MRRNQWSNLRSVSVEEGPRSRSLLREMERKARNTRELGLQVCINYHKFRLFCLPSFL